MSIRNLIMIYYEYGLRILMWYDILFPKGREKIWDMDKILKAYLMKKG